jgi:hypothetical protein
VSDLLLNINDDVDRLKFSRYRPSEDNHISSPHTICYYKNIWYWHKKKLEYFLKRVACYIMPIVLNQLYVILCLPTFWLLFFCRKFTNLLIIISSTNWSKSNKNYNYDNEPPSEDYKVQTIARAEDALPSLTLHHGTWTKLVVPADRAHRDELMSAA